MRNLIRLIPAGLLGVGAAVLVSCGSSGAGLIPAQYAGPLKSDFQAVLQAAQEGDGSCAATAAKIGKTEADLQALPATVDRGLRGRLAEGVATLSRQARVMCKEPLSRATTTTGTSTTATSATIPPPTSSAPTTTPTTGASTSPSESSSEEGGATRAPGKGKDEGSHSAEGEPEPGSEPGPSGGAEAGENGGGAGAGGSEGATGGTGSGK
ncbi:MAG TPA: hypothetical protein VK756_03345 [Solirubrobacteraceae bacterium]|jgi:hypothetical protein|nr:hypothetical protein [Solirubrobacteraceae bacterium]